MNPVTNKIYVANDGSSNVTVINGANQHGHHHGDRLGAYPDAVAVNPVTNVIYVANSAVEGPGNVTVINGATNAVTATVAVGTESQSHSRKPGDQHGLCGQQQ